MVGALSAPITNGYGGWRAERAYNHAERGWEAGIRTPMPAFKGLCPTVRRPPNFGYCAVGETRTLMTLRTHAPEACLYTNFSTTAITRIFGGPGRARTYNPCDVNAVLCH